MHCIDLHCDTLYKAVTQGILLDDESVEVNPSKDAYSHKLQCYAIWLPDELNGDEAEKLFYSAYNIICRETERLKIKLLGRYDKYNNSINKNINSAFLTIENGVALNGKIKNVRKFADMGVKIMTLTWNDANNIGDGVKSLGQKGLTKFGRDVIKEMEKEGIIVDISHACDKLFYDVAEIAEKPFVATHSNSRYITNNPRNLTNEQISYIVKSGGIIGLNFHNKFLNNDADKASKLDILKHTEHFLSLGSENCLCFGADFDGCTLPEDIKGSLTMTDIYEMFLKHNYKEGLVQRIFYKNADNFFENFDNQRIM